MTRILISLLFVLAALISPARAQFPSQQEYVIGAGSANAQTASFPNATTLADILGVPLRVKAAATNTAATTLTVNAFSAQNILKTSPSGPVALTGSPPEIVNGQIFTVVWDGSNFQLISAVSNAPSPSACQFSGLKIVNDGGAGSANSVAEITFNSATLVVPSTNLGLHFGASSGGMLNVNITTTGAGGFDTGSATANGFVKWFVISDGVNIAGVGTNAVNASPTLPGGYTYSCYAGSTKVNGASNMYGTRQLGNEARYVNGGNLLSSLPVIVNGAGGSGCTGSSPTYASEVVQGNSGAAPLWVPPTAVAVDVLMNPFFTAGGATLMLLAPNSSYGGFPSSTANTNPPFAWSDASFSTGLFRILLESASIYYCTAASGSALHAYGWKDAVNAN